MKHSIREFGRSDQLDAALGLTTPVASKLASIVVYAASIEYHLERALWVCEGVDPKGIRPRTDGKQISELITMLETWAKKQPDVATRDIMVTWSKAAQFGFVIRNNIAHGVAAKNGSIMVVSRNPRWDGEDRVRAFGSLKCESSTLDLIRDSLATLLRVISGVEKNRAAMARLADPVVVSALQDAQSILGEFADQFYNPSFEKY
ncbi:MAG: hypothetical protein ACK5Z6_11310 [Hyphomonadaceae bacterium]|jgi:hypothetical protein